MLHIINNIKMCGRWISLTEQESLWLLAGCTSKPPRKQSPRVVMQVETFNLKASSPPHPHPTTTWAQGSQLSIQKRGQLPNPHPGPGLQQQFTFKTEREPCAAVNPDGGHSFGSISEAAEILTFIEFFNNVC